MTYRLLALSVPFLLFWSILGGCVGPSSQATRVPCADADELARWEFTDPAAFRWGRDEDSGAGCLELHGKSSYQPPHRSPLALAILRDTEFGDGTIRVKARQTGREYPHRDLVFVFAWRDPAHYVYVHLASKGDANAHQVMLVDGAPRRPVTTTRTAGVSWGEGWHDVELRRAADRVAVHFDGVEVMTGIVPRWRGRVGVGSFDDTGRFRDLVVTPTN